MPPDQLAERPLAGLAAADFSEVSRPLHPFRNRILTIEGLSHTSVLAEIAEVLRAGSGDSDNHSVAVAHLLTGAAALQRAGTPCTGGARSIDQELAARTAAPGRFGSRVYGYDYLPNASVSQFSFLGSGQAAPGVDAALIDTAIAIGNQRFEAQRIPFDTCLIRPDATAEPQIVAQLRQKDYACVVIGGGLRKSDDAVALLERVIHLIREHAPGAAIAFNTNPTTSADAALRWLSP